MIAGALLLCAIAAVAAVPLFDHAALEWLTENSTCNGEPCTEKEARTIATAVTAIAGAAGASLLLAGTLRAVRGGESGGGAMEPGAAAGRADASERSMEALARLDEAYGRGEVDEEDYLRRRDELTGRPADSLRW